jgi:hypothetical protein
MNAKNALKIELFLAEKKLFLKKNGNILTGKKFTQDFPPKNNIFINIFSKLRSKEKKLMATPQLSPGILVREVDLTVGRADNVLDNIGAIASPFAIGPIDEPIDITTENELINVFGKPFSTDAQYEYWMSASSYLSYGGVLKVVRTDGAELVNANAIRNSAGISTAGEPTLKLKILMITRQIILMILQIIFLQQRIQDLGQIISKFV